MGILVYMVRIKINYYYKIICIMVLISLIFYLSILIFTTTSKPARAQSLPKIVWTYQQNSDANFLHSLCFHRIKNVLQQSRWVLQVITPQNIFVYLHEHQQYKQMVKNYHKQLVFIEEVEIVKLFVLKEYGGIWMDPSTILLESVDWIQYIQSINGIQTYQNNAYQMVIFESKNTKQNQHSFYVDADDQTQEFVPINLGILLALKQSPIISKWITKLNQQLKKIIQINEQQNRIKIISSRALSNLLQNDKATFQQSLKQHKIWKLKYSDFYLEDTDNPYILADFYLKYPYQQIKSTSKNHKYFILLDHVSRQLNQILNPNISKLSYANHLQGLGNLEDLQFKCAHYVEYRSIIYTLLIKDSEYQHLFSKSIDKNHQLFRQCSNFYGKQWLRQTILVIKYTFYAISIYIVIKIQKLCVQLLWVKSKSFIKPRYTLFKNILTTIKSVVQYQANQVQ